MNSDYHSKYEKCSCGYDYCVTAQISHTKKTTTNYCKSTTTCTAGCGFSTSWNNGNHNYTKSYTCRGISTKLCSVCKKCRYCGGTH